ncbi:MAG: fumarylacetoacetate hydrolase family protein [Prevotella sp.]|nr:fumarylacetoacetate hydrolase family protein [Prevotella sp.]
MKIFGVGMNYLQHTEELDGHAYRPSEPVIFLKADSALLKNRKPFFLPDWAGRVDYEAELVVRICRLGKGIPVRFAHRYWDALTVGIDFTARTLQQQARSQGMPWTICKGFDGSAVIGEWQTHPQPLPIGRGADSFAVEKADDKSIYSPPYKGGARGGSVGSAGSASGSSSVSFHLTVNGQMVQQGCTADMLFSIDEIISYLSRFFTLKTGDLIFTGTPAGVGPVSIGDHLQGYLGEERVLDFYCR